MAGKVSFKFKDHAGQSSTFALATDDVNAGNLATITTQMGALKTAIEGVTLGRVANETLLAINTDNGQTAASDPIARREMKWLLRLVDSVTLETLTRELPTADPTLTTANGEEADMADAAWVSLKGAIDGIFNNPETGNSLLLVGAKFVGRNI